MTDTTNLLLKCLIVGWATGTVLGVLAILCVVVLICLGVLP
jgi:hypothetical protein